jgi:hypothetical protein
MGYAEFKAPKGVIKVELELEGGAISRISITGDFFLYPEDALEQLEQMLIGVKMNRENLLAVVQKFYSTAGVRSPMIKPEHWVEAILRAAGS